MYAYSFSKMTIENEMGDFQKYTSMKLVEFYEFLSRWAQYTFKEIQQPLPIKLQMLLEIILPIAGRTFIPPGDQEVESESDYDDDLVTSMVQEISSAQTTSID